MNKMTDYRVLTVNGGAYRHLGSMQRGMRTACGRLLKADETLVELPGSVDVGCLSCKGTWMMRQAVASGQVSA